MINSAFSAAVGNALSLPRVPRSSPERFDASFYRRFYLDPAPGW